MKVLFSFLLVALLATLGSTDGLQANIGIKKGLKTGSALSRQPWVQPLDVKNGRTNSVVSPSAASIRFLRFESVQNAGMTV